MPDKTPPSQPGKDPSAAPRVFFTHFEPHSANFGQTLTLAEALHEEGWDIQILCRDASHIAETARAAQLQVHTFPDDAGNGLLTAWKFLRLIHKLGLKKGVPGLLHACDPSASHLVSHVWRLDKSLRIAHTRRMPVMETNSKAIRCYQTPPAKIVTDSLAGKIALRLSGIEPHLLHTIPCGFAPSEQPPRQERGDGRIVFAVIGDLLPWGGHSLLFDAIKLLDLQEDLPPWEVRILSDGPHFHSLLEEAQAKKVDGRLAFLGGQDIPGQLALCDILVLPAGEGESHMPHILRGWAARLPLVAANRLDHAENLQDGGNCLLAQLGDMTSLATQMARLGNDAELRSHLVNGGCESLAKFPIRHMTLEYKRLFAQIMG